MGDTLPRAEYEKVYDRRLSNDCAGASNKPGRMVIAALIIKHKMNLYDEETILAIQENPNMQYMCDLTEYTDKPLFDPSLFVTICKRFTIDDINALILELARRSRERQKKKDDNDAGGGNQTNRAQPQSGDLKADATCADAEVRYPTDIDLVEDGSKHVDRLAGKAKARVEFGAKIGVSVVSGYSFINHHS